MSKMKNSGVTWIGEIPENWKLYTIGSIFKTRNIKVSDKDYPPLSVSKGGIVPQLENVAKSDANDNRKLVLKNDFAINSRSDRKQSCGLSLLDGSVSLINTVIYPRSSSLIEPLYTDYLLKNYGFAEEFYRWGHGIVADLWTTKWQEMKNIILPLPSIDEQKKIYETISHKSNSIDKLLSIQEQQIENLKAYKQSLITETVTKGLNFNVEMKASGIDWIGDIPQKWEVKKLKYITTFINLKWNESYMELEYLGLENIESASGKKITTESVYDRSQSIIFKKGDILFGKLRPYLAKVYLSTEDGCCSNEFSVIRAIENFDKKYLWSALISSGFIEQVNFSTYGTKMPRANAEFIKNMYLPIPPLEEQHMISNYLIKKCNDIDKLIKIKQQKIEKLNEYKKSLIYEYVTGKKEVI